MVEINLFKSKEFDCKIPFPSAWDELSKDDLLIVSREQLSAEKPIAAQQAAIFDALLKLRAKKFPELPRDFNTMLDPEEAAIAAINLLDFLYKKNNLTVQLYPDFTFSGKTFYGPEGNFDSITCGEFEDTEIFFQDFVADPRPEPVAHLCAILWRQKDQDYMFFDAKKNVWKTYDHEPFLQQFTKLSEPQLYAIFTWYAGCRSLLPGWFPDLYGGGGDESAATDMLVFTKCIHAGAGEKNGSRTDIRRMLLKEFFMDMNLSAKSNKNLAT